MTTPFRGYSKKTVQFLDDLAANNSRPWFEQNRSIYQESVLKELSDFVVAMGDRLSAIAPEVVAVPKVDKSIFRIHRDTRFSPNKKPYKTHIGAFFWEGTKKKMENSGFYFHLEPERLFLGVGLYKFPRDFLPVYRSAVTHPELGPALEAAVAQVQTHPEYSLGWKGYKRVPRGHDPEHPRSHFLLHAGLGFQYEERLNDRVFSPELIDDVFERFRHMSPVHHWLLDVAQRAEQDQSE